MPDPDPAPSLPSTSSFTTDGSTLSATCSTDPSAAGESGVSMTCEAVGVPPPSDEEPPPSSSKAVQAAAPPTPAAPPTTSAAVSTEAAKAPRLGRRRGGGATGSCSVLPKGCGGWADGGGYGGWTLMAPSLAVQSVTTLKSRFRYGERRSDDVSCSSARRRG